MILEEIARFAEDIDKTVEFYQRLFGVPPTAWTRGQVAAFQLGPVRFFLHRRMEEHEPGWPLKDEDHVSFAVKNVDEACKELRTRGLHLEVGPQDFYWGRSAYLRDPDGRLLELHQTSSTE